MADYFRTKIVSKRQITLPQLMLQRLGLKEGDELEFTVEGGQIDSVQPYRLVPADYFTPEVMEMIERRKLEMANGIHGGVLSLPLEQASKRKGGRGIEALEVYPEVQLAESVPKGKVSAAKEKEVESY